jgi:carboxyl-terminal processing protease
MKPFIRSFAFSLLIIGVVIASFTAGYFLRGQYSNQERTFPLLNQAYNILMAHGYYSPPADPALEYGMIHGLVAAYGDPFTSFAEPVQHELETNTLQGTFGGIGADIGKDPLGNHVLYPYPDGPAAKAGILEGDYLVRVDDFSISPETTTEEIHAAIRGPVGETVQINISRPPDLSEYVFIITRQEIPLPSVTWHIESNDARLGVIQVNIIAATTSEEIIKAVRDLQSRGAVAYALDLRNNSGGLLDAGIEISSIFLEKGTIIEQQYRGQAVETFTIDRPGELSQIPLVVLVNHQTASAAEIIAGSLQANERAILVGTPTYGKNTIQLVFDLNDGSSLHITAATWWIHDRDETAADHRIHPDILIDPTTAGIIDPFIQEALSHFFTDQ